MLLLRHNLSALILKLPVPVVTKNPPFILLDEATASLDTITENSVQVALDRLGAERTVLVIAHRLGTSELSGFWSL